jgi:hypothetical protein
MRKMKMKETIRLACLGFGERTFSAYDIYYTMMNRPKKLGGARKNIPSYAEIKQILPRSEFVEKIKIESDEKPRMAIYKNKGLNG